MRTLPLLLLGACLTSSNYGTVAATTACERLESCEDDGGTFSYDDVADCVDVLAPLFGGSCFQQHCTFDASAANTCVAALRTTDCDGESPVDDPDCLGVWDDCKVVDLGLCVAGGGN